VASKETEEPRSLDGRRRRLGELLGQADPVAILRAQEATRVPELVPLRHERMLESPFTFYRGAA
jgi:hypothetical protein